MRLALSWANSAPWVTPTMRDGTRLRLRTTSAGVVGWHADAAGYRYLSTHPTTGLPWPPLPDDLASLAGTLASEAGFRGFAPTTCLANLYGADGSLGLHRDVTERDDGPVVSLSLGDSCWFRFGEFGGEWLLRSGDVVVFGGPARYAPHGVPCVFAGTSGLVPGGGRLNLTLRRA